MYSPIDIRISYVCIIITMVCWGSWTSIRSLCIAEGPVFFILYVFGEFSSSLLSSLTFGMAQSSNYGFDHKLFIIGNTEVLFSDNNFYLLFRASAALESSPCARNVLFWFCRGKRGFSYINCMRPHTVLCSISDLCWSGTR